MKRVEKGERYWCVGGDMNPIEAIAGFDWAMDTLRFEAGNCFKDYHECFVMCNKLRHVLAGADVIQMPSEDELKQKADEHALSVFYKYNDEEINEQTCKDSFLESIEWLKSKTIK